MELYAEKVNNRGLCAVAQAESLRYKLLGGLAVRRYVSTSKCFLEPLQYPFSYLLFKLVGVLAVRLFVWTSKYFHERLRECPFNIFFHLYSKLVIWETLILHTHCHLSANLLFQVPMYRHEYVKLFPLECGIQRIFLRLQFWILRLGKSWCMKTTIDAWSSTYFVDG